MTSTRELGWRLFDQIINGAPLAGTSPWSSVGDRLVFTPDYDTLSQLLGVPVLLGASSQSGVPALALDVWVAYELRRAGFHPDKVWPRSEEPRVIPTEVLDFIDSLPSKLAHDLRDRVALGRVKGAAKSANLLGKNYVKQVDVVMSSWATGPELLISTKRMDSSFGKNAANRVEESYGDAKNLRLRHPQAALGFVYGLNAIALEKEPDKAEWLIDLLGKLGREEDAYDAVALVMPDLSGNEEPQDAEPRDPTGPRQAGATDETEASDEQVALDETLGVESVRPVSLYQEVVPAALCPGRFFEKICQRVLENSPVNFHGRARELRRIAREQSGEMPMIAALDEAVGPQTSL